MVGQLLRNIRALSNAATADQLTNKITAESLELKVFKLLRHQVLYCWAYQIKEKTLKL